MGKSLYWWIWIVRTPRGMCKILVYLCVIDIECHARTRLVPNVRTGAEVAFRFAELHKMTSFLGSAIISFELKHTENFYERTLNVCARQSLFRSAAQLCIISMQCMQCNSSAVFMLMFWVIYACELAQLTELLSCNWNYFYNLRLVFEIVFALVNMEDKETDIIPLSTDLLRTSHQTRVWGEQWMTFLGNPYINTRCGQYALSYRLPVWGDLGMRYRGNLSGLSSIYTRYRVCRKSSQWLFSFWIHVSSFYYNISPLSSANEKKYNRLPLLIIFTGHIHSYYHSVLTVVSINE